MVHAKWQWNLQTCINSIAVASMYVKIHFPWIQNAYFRDTGGSNWGGGAVHCPHSLSKPLLQNPRELEKRLVFRKCRTNPRLLAHHIYRPPHRIQVGTDCLNGSVYATDYKKRQVLQHTLQKTHIRVYVSLSDTTLKIHITYLKTNVDFKCTNVARIILYTQTEIWT
jgi:hypothetical protein